MLSIIPVERITGIKKIARNAPLPAAFWLSITAIKSEKMRIAGISNASCCKPFTRI